MALKRSTGNMYPWVTHMHSHLGGEFPHKCIYCYVDNPRFGRPERYKGKLRLLDWEFKVNYESGNTIFIEHKNDLFAEEIPRSFIIKILSHCLQYPNNIYVFQTKNPNKYLDIQSNYNTLKFPDNSILGTTIETNRIIPKISTAPIPEERYKAMLQVKGRKFVTIEPVLDFDVDIFAKWIADINPEFLNLGADSKNHHLPEPTVNKIFALVDRLKKYGIELREKHNLNRLKRK